MRKLLVAVSCFALLTGFTNQGPVLPLPAKLLTVPVILQQKDFSCGDVSSLSILRYWHPDTWDKVKEGALYKPLKTSSKAGTDPQPIADFLSKQPGLKAEYVKGATLEQLEASVDRGEPAIVNIQAWQAVPRAKDLKPWATDWIDGHYVVLVGYDQHSFYFMDPSTQGHYTYIPRAQLPDRWHDVVGAKNVHTQHIVVFVRSTLPRPAAKRPTQPSKTKVTIIN
jgi:predicted double-glycine peptidase